MLPLFSTYNVLNAFIIEFYDRLPNKRKEKHFEKKIINCLHDSDAYHDFFGMPKLKYEKSRTF